MNNNSNNKKLNNIYLWTGNGWGKTTSALGVALRAVGHGKRVVIIQFMKGRKDIGEYMVASKLEPNYEIYQFGRREFVNLSRPTAEDKKLAQEGFEFAKGVAQTKPFLLILDEINLATAIGLIKVETILDFLDKAPKEVTIYLTGRRAPPKLKARADYVTEIRAIKHPKLELENSKIGIDF